MTGRWKNVALRGDKGPSPTKGGNETAKLEMYAFVISDDKNTTPDRKKKVSELIIGTCKNCPVTKFFFFVD